MIGYVTRRRALTRGNHHDTRKEFGVSDDADEFGVSDDADDDDKIHTRHWSKLIGLKRTRRDFPRLKRNRLQYTSAMLLVFAVPWMLVRNMRIKPTFPNHHPRMIHLNVRNTTDQEHYGYSVHRLDIRKRYNPTYRKIRMSIRELQRLQHPTNSGDVQPEPPFETEDCRAQYPWQLASYPTCNTLFENGDLSSDNYNQLEYKTHGYYRDVWRLGKSDRDEPPVVLKTLRYIHPYNGRNYDRHRRDAVASERLTASPFVVDIYGFCANSAVMEYSEEGDMTHALFRHIRNPHVEPLKSLEKLEMATQAALGLADVHNVDKKGVASMAHTDLTPKQYILFDGVYKLNDFNRVRFIRWNRKKDEPCTYRVGKNPGSFRSPEEYAYRPQTEKVDVYSLGNVFYMLLQEEWPFSDTPQKEVGKLVQQGIRPSFDAEIWNTTDPSLNVIKLAMIRCHEQNATQRTSALEVSQYLQAQLTLLKSNN